MSRREFTRAQKAAIVLRATDERGMVACEGCGLVLGKKPYEIDHTIPEALIVDKTRPLTIEDGQLLGKECCHRGGQRKTAAEQARIAKSYRQRDLHLGLKKKGRFPKKPPGYRHSWRTGRLEKETEV